MGCSKKPKSRGIGTKTTYDKLRDTMKKGTLGQKVFSTLCPRSPFPFDILTACECRMRVSADARNGEGIVPSYVPMVHDDRYFFCSAVKLSMGIPMALSFSLAIAISISAGTGYTSLLNFVLLLTMCSMLRA